MNLLSNEQHITQELLLRYVKDDCSRTEMRAIDRHLATCSMCSDAIEGLLLLSEPSIAVAQLDKRIEGKMAEKIIEQPIGTSVDLAVEQPIFEVVKRPFWQQRWAAAAAVLLLASGSIWVYKNTGKAEKQATASAEIQAVPNAELARSAPAIAQDSSYQTPQYVEVKKTKKDEIVADLNTSNEITNTGVTPVQQEARKKTTYSANSEAVEDSTIPNTDIAAITDNASREKSVPQVVVASPMVYSTKTDRTRENVEVSPQGAPQNAPQSAYSTAKKAKEVKIEEVERESKQADKSLQEVVIMDNAKVQKTMPTAKRTPSVSTASDPILSRADDYFNKKNYQAALADYAQFVAQEMEGDNHERALFQLANCYLKLNKKADAKVLFEKLSVTNGQYQRAAKKALKDL